MPEEKNDDLNKESAASAGEASSPLEAEVVSESQGQEDRESEVWKEKYIRLLADFDNHRKRTARDLDEARKFSNEAIVRSFLPVLDNLERALQHVGKQEPEGESSCQGLIEGVRLTHKQFLELLEKNHVTKIQTEGVPFDPEVHEAVGYTESDLYPEGMVVDVYQQGYRIHNRLVRPSMVTVSKGNST